MDRIAALKQFIKLLKKPQSNCWLHFSDKVIYQSRNSVFSVIKIDCPACYFMRVECGLDEWHFGGNENMEENELVKNLYDWLNAESKKSVKTESDERLADVLQRLAWDVDRTA